MTAWLVESSRKTPSNSPLWLRMYAYYSNGVPGKPEPEWTEHSELAWQFARKQDAEYAVLLYPQMCALAFVSEHVFVE
jgi:hypothetical protein